MFNMEWIHATNKLPPIDELDQWDMENKISKYVLTYSKKWGMRFGRYFYNTNNWQINGVTSSEGVNVDYWIEIKEPFINP